MPTTEGQYRTDEFIGEVIGIARLCKFQLDMAYDDAPEHRVQAWVAFDSLDMLGTVTDFRATGRTMGFALAAVRQQIKEHYGR